MAKDYKELVRLLKDNAERLDYDGWVDTAAVMEQAAEAIEELLKLPTPVRPFFLTCNCEEKYERTDCAHYDEEQDMGAHIPFCRLYKRSGYCPCLGCEKYERRVKLPESSDEENKHD